MLFGGVTMKELSSFPSEDGHIESILIGVDTVKVSFQTWDARQLVLLFENVCSVEAHHAVYGDIGAYEECTIDGETKQYCFYDSWDDGEKVVLKIQAESLRIYQVGNSGAVNSALFDVGYDYIGNQELEIT